MNFTSNRKTKGIGALEVTTLVDIVFLLLIFFLLTATYVKNPNLDINLPKASSNQTTSHQKELTVAIKKDGEIRYENEQISMEKLNGILSARFSEDKSTIVVVRADEGAKHGRVVQVMDAAKKVGFEKLAIAIQSSSN